MSEFRGGDDDSIVLLAMLLLLLLQPERERERNSGAFIASEFVYMRNSLFYEFVESVFKRLTVY